MSNEKDTTYITKCVCNLYGMGGCSTDMYCSNHHATGVYQTTCDNVWRVMNDQGREDCRT